MKKIVKSSSQLKLQQNCSEGKKGSSQLKLFTDISVWVRTSLELTRVCTMRKSYPSTDDTSSSSNSKLKFPYSIVTLLIHQISLWSVRITDQYFWNDTCNSKCTPVKVCVIGRAECTFNNEMPTCVLNGHILCMFCVHQTVMLYWTVYCINDRRI